MQNKAETDLIHDGSTDDRLCADRGSALEDLADVSLEPKGRGEGPGGPKGKEPVWRVRKTRITWKGRGRGVEGGDVDGCVFEPPRTAYARFGFGMSSLLKTDVYHFLEQHMSFSFFKYSSMSHLSFPSSIITKVKLSPAQSKSN